MSRKEAPRAGLVKAALEGKITNAEGARALRISVRQFISRATVRRVRVALGRPARRRRQAPKHRRRRPRVPAMGQPV